MFAVSTKQCRRQVQWTEFELWIQQPNRATAGQTTKNFFFSGLSFHPARIGVRLDWRSVACSAEKQISNSWQAIKSLYLCTAHPRPDTFKEGSAKYLIKNPSQFRKAHKVAQWKHKNMCGMGLCVHAGFLLRPKWYFTPAKQKAAPNRWHFIHYFTQKYIKLVKGA